MLIRDISRRRFLAGSAAVGTAGMVGLPRLGRAQGERLNLRFDGDNDILT